jgi:hypothetical protein
MYQAYYTRNVLLDSVCTLYETLLLLADYEDDGREHSERVTEPEHVFPAFNARAQGHSIGNMPNVAAVPLRHILSRQSCRKGLQVYSRVVSSVPIIC